MKIETAQVEPQNLKILIYGDYGSGKSHSMMRLLQGIHSVVGGQQPLVICTDNRRSSLLAEHFEFKRICLEPPYSGTRLAEACKLARSAGHRIVGLDDGSVEHFFYLNEQREVRAELGAKYNKDEMKFDAAGWNVAKETRRPLDEEYRGFPGHFVATFHAKLSRRADGNRAALGWTPIAGAAFLKYSTATCFLDSGANGRPTWQAKKPENSGTAIKLAKSMLPYPDLLDEATGARWARWATGTPAELSKLAIDMIAKLEKAPTPETLAQVHSFVAAAFGDLTGAHDERAVNDAATSANKRIADSERKAK